MRHLSIVSPETRLGHRPSRTSQQGRCRVSARFLSVSSQNLQGLRLGWRLERHFKNQSTLDRADMKGLVKLRDAR